MVNTTKLECSLRLRHPEANLAPIAKAIGLRVAAAWKKGDTRVSPKGTVLKGFREDSYCSMRLGTYKRMNVADALVKCLEKLKPSKLKLQKVVRSGGTVSIAIGWFCTGDVGASIPASIAERLSELDITLDLYIYLET
jgi:hypothetical protein